MIRNHRRAAVLLMMIGLHIPPPSHDEARLLALINSDRAGAGLTTLAWDPTLARMARAHAADMAAAGRISHLSSADGASFETRLGRSELRVRAAAENVARDRDVTSAHQSLMASPGHRKNLLDPDLTAVGLGIVATRDEGIVYVVEDFAAPIAALSDVEARRTIERALFEAARSGMLLPNDAALSGRLAKVVESLVAADSVEGTGGSIPGPAWLYTFTTVDPAVLPEEIKDRLSRARGYGLAVVYRRTAAHPLGVYWVALALSSGGDDLMIQGP